MAFERSWEDKAGDFERSYYAGRCARNLWAYIPERFADAVDETAIDADGYWIYLKEGYTSQDGGEDCRTIHDYTISGLKAAIKTIRKGGTP